MNISRTKIILALALASGGVAFAQTDSGIPRPADYASFSRFVTDRNIFDPNRQPHSSSTRPHTRTTRTRASLSAPAFTLVGTMGYQKGLFAFFSGNNDDIKKVLPVAGKIADYNVTQIVQGRVTLEATNKSEKFELKIGDVMRQENGKWALAGAAELPAGTVASEPSATSSSGNDNPAPAPSSALGQSEVLKRLMQLRAKENQ